LQLSKVDDAHGYNGKVFTVISLLEFVIVFIYAFKSEWYQYFLPFWYLEHIYLQYIGWGLLLLSLVLVWVAQSQMANSWRIGIDEKNKTELTQIRLEEAFLKSSHGKAYQDYLHRVRRWL